MKAQVEILDIGDLFTRAFARWKERVWTLLGLLLILFCAVAVLALPFAGIVFAALAMKVPMAVLSLVPLIFLILLTPIAGWYGAAYTQLIMDDTLPLKEAIFQSRKHAWSFLWAQLIPALGILSGLLLCFIPGLVLIPLFAFAPFAYFCGAKGALASHRSFQLVKARYWVVLLLVYLAYLVPGAGSALPMVGVVISIVLKPFSSLFMHEIYKDLCTVTPKTMEQEDPQVKVILYISVIVLILATGAAVGLTFLYSDDLFSQAMKLLPKR